MAWCGGPSTTPATQALRLALGRGIVAGVPDLFVLHRGIAHMIEIKTPAGALSDPQRSVMAAVLASGGRVGVVRNAEEVLGLLDAWGHPAGAAPGAACECRGVRQSLAVH